jgi:outer membrane protein assembly factor BamB
MRGALFTFIAITTYAADWPQWRGPNRDGISTETGLLKTWPSEGPKLVWKAQGLGEGYSAFSVVGDRLYTQGQRGNEAYVMAFDTNTGKKVWETPAGGAFRERRGNGPRGTPTVDGERLYALNADGNLLCLDRATGKRVWAVDLVKQHGGLVPNWGISESPLVLKDRVIVTPGGNGSSVVALDKTNGGLIWKSQNDGAAYSSPILVNTGGVDHIVAFTSDAVMGLSVAKGDLFWRYDKVANGVANIATPLHKDGYVFVSSDYGTGCALLKLGSASGKVTASEVYFNRDMKNHYSSSVLVNGYLYGFNSTVLTAMKFDNGQVAWRDRSVGKGSVTYADGNLYVLGENGAIALVEPSPTAYEEKSRFEISRGNYPTWTPPVIANGRMYIRDQDTLYSFDVKAR